jgi:O-antigen ligase
MSLVQTSAGPGLEAKAHESVARPAEAGRLEIAAAAFCLVQFSEPLFAAIAQSQGLTEPPAYARVFFLPVYAFLALVVWRDRSEAKAAIRATPLLFGLLIFAFVSSLWSIDAAATLRRTVWLALTMTYGLYLAWRYSWKGMLEVIACAYGVLIAGSFATAVLAPHVGVMQSEHAGAWCGLWTHKNMLGGYMALGAGIGLAASVLSPERRKLWLAVALGAFVLVLLSSSKTALLASSFELVVIASLAIARRGPLLALTVASTSAFAAVGVGALMVLSPDTLLSLIGRDLTLTGRTDIWNAAASAVKARPWLGYGYYAFWLDAEGPAYWVRRAVGWNVASAHSGWLELALGLGRIGVIAFALQFAATLWRSARAFLDPAAGLAPPALLLAFALYSFSESHMLSANDLFWLIYVAVAARLSLDAGHAARLQRKQAGGMQALTAPTMREA